MMMFVQASGAGMDIPLLLCRGSSFVLSEGYCLSCLAISMIRISGMDGKENSALSL